MANCSIQEQRLWDEYYRIEATVTASIQSIYGYVCLDEFNQIFEDEYEDEYMEQLAILDKIANLHGYDGWAEYELERTGCKWSTPVWN